MAWKTYTAEDFTLTIAELYEFNDWISISVNDNQPSFTYETGAFGEPFVSMNRDNSANIVLTMPMQSKENDSLEYLYASQKFGVVGVPMMLKEGELLTLNTDLVEKTPVKILFQVSFLLGRPDREYAEQAGELVYKFQTTDQNRILI